MAATVETTVGSYHANGRDIPCLVLAGYDVSGNATTTKANVVTADLMLIGQGDGNAYRAGVTKGTAAGNFEFGTAWS